eukprot:2296449-Prymnesium_polylepis.1
MPPHTFQVPLARPTHSRAVRRPTIPPGERGDAQRERTRSKRSIPPTVTRTPHHLKGKAVIAQLRFEEND